MTRKIYKYFPYTEYSLTCLKNKTLWHSRPTAFNDPFECRLLVPQQETIINGLNEYRKLHPQFSNLPDDIFVKLALSVNQDRFNSFGICCFSSVPDEITMWSYYAQNHEGFCLCFEGDCDEIGIYPIKYQEEYPQLNFANWNNIENGIVKILLTKSIHWSHEKELRQIKAPINNTSYPSEVPYNCTLTQVIFGCKMTTENRNTIRNILKDSVEYWEAILHPYKYEVVLNDERIVKMIGNNYYTKDEN